MEIQLSPELEQIINSKVVSGRYPNADEFIREAILRTVENDQVKYARLNEAVSLGLQEAEKGEFSSRTVQDIIRDKEADKSGKRKMSNYKLTRMADHDLVGIWEYTNKSWGKKQARKYLNQLEEQFLALASTPAIGKIRHDLISSPQSYCCGRHIIFYRKRENGIEILRVLHDSMDFPRHFK